VLKYVGETALSGLLRFSAASLFKIARANENSISFMETNAIYCKDKIEIMRRDIVKNSIDATSIDEARQLIEAGFEYIMDVNSIKLFRTRK
jgi:hypothetical protein